MKNIGMGARERVCVSECMHHAYVVFAFAHLHCTMLSFFFFFITAYYLALLVRQPAGRCWLFHFIYLFIYSFLYPCHTDISYCYCALAHTRTLVTIGWGNQGSILWYINQKASFGLPFSFFRSIGQFRPISELYTVFQVKANR